MEANLLGFNGVVLTVVVDVPVDSETSVDDFVNFEDMSAQSSKMLKGVEFAYVHRQILIRWCKTVYHLWN